MHQVPAGEMALTFKLYEREKLRSGEQIRRYCGCKGEMNNWQASVKTTEKKYSQLARETDEGREEMNNS